MKKFAPAQQGFTARRPAKSPQELRATWISVLAMAGEVTRAAGDPLAAEAMAPGLGQTTTRLAATLRVLEADNFPVIGSSAQTMAAAFLRLARDFVHPAWPAEARTACAPFLKAGADCLDRLLDGQRRELSSVSRRITGEREDD